ncbi:hypothetical protein Tco_0149341 [Tanacetum coccineum]
MEEVDSDLDSMPGDEIESLFGFKADETDDDHHQYKHKEELSKTGKVAADNIIDELVDMANTQDVNLNASADKPNESDPLGHLHKEISSLTAKERIPELLSDTLKNILLQIIKDSVKQFVKKALPKFDKRAEKTLKAQVLEIILKPLNREFNALNKMESSSVMSGRKIKVVHDLLKYCVGKIDKNVIDMLDLVDLTRDLVILIDPVSTSPKATTRRGNMSTRAKKDPKITIPTPAQGEQQPTDSTTEPATTEEAQVNA